MTVTNGFVFIGLETFEQKNGCDFGVVHFGDQEIKPHCEIYFRKGSGVLTQTFGGNKLRVDKLNIYLKTE